MRTTYNLKWDVLKNWYSGTDFNKFDTFFALNCFGLVGG